MPDVMDFIFPKAQPDDPEAYEEGEKLPPSWSFENDKEVQDEIEEYVKKGYLRRVRGREALVREVGKYPVISNFHVLKRSKNGKVKRRLIIDLRKSGMTARTKRTHRVVLPRGTDVVRDLLGVEDFLVVVVKLFSDFVAALEVFVVGIE